MTAFGYVWWGLMFLLGFTLWYVIKSETEDPSGGNKDE